LKTKTLVLALAAIVVAVAGYAAISANRDSRTARILFIGNSLTYSNDLPAMLAAIAHSRGDTVIFDEHTPGGTRLRQHVANENVYLKIRQQGWDFVVLQEHSVLQTLTPEQVESDVLPHARHLAAESRKANPDAQLIFYMTMAHRIGDPGNPHLAPSSLTYEASQLRVNRRYLRMARDNRALIAPVGEAWRIVRKERPDIALYSDIVHPSPNGTYLGACVFYATLFRKPCAGAAVPNQISQPIAEFLQKTADDVVLRSGQRWDWRK
jgi:hypothetical protein